MYKLATALLVSSVAGSDITIGQIPLQNYLSKDLVKNMISTLRIKANGLGESGKVTYSQCDDDTASFLLDTASTFNSPDRITKGVDLNFNLAGILTSDIHVNNVHVHVDWNGSSLYSIFPTFDEDHKQSTAFSDNFDMTLGWSIPSYAPDGAYAVQIVGYDDNSKKTNFCIKGDFIL